MRSKTIIWCFSLSGILSLLYIHTHISQDDTVWRFLFRKVKGFHQERHTTNKPVRQDHCDGCFNFTPAFHLTMSTKSACLISNTGDSFEEKYRPGIDVLVLVSSATFHKDNRMAIRNTWGTWTRNNTANVRVVFVVGHSNNDVINQDIVAEQKLFQDIVFGYFMDSYDNLTYQTISALNWAVHSCPRARFVMKTDDDVWLNIPALLKLLSRVGLQQTLGGHCYHGEYPRRVKTNSKWFCSYEDFPRDVFPDYCSGGAYVMPMHLARAITQVSKNTPFFRFEDVYIGLCLENLGYHVTDLPGFSFHSSKADICELKMDHVISSYGFRPRDLLTVWNHQSHCSCPMHCRYFIFYFLCAVLFIVSTVIFRFLYRRYFKLKCHRYWYGD